MWDTFRSHPLGRLSMRKFLAVATSLLVACFVYIIASSPLVNAADAEFSNNMLTYDNQRFSGPFTASGTSPPGLAKDVKYFTADNPDDATKRLVITFPSATDPMTATQASLRTADVNNNGDIRNLSSPQPISVGQSTNTAAQSSCQVDGVGWMVCSLSKWIADGVDYLYSVLTKFLNFEPLTTTSGTNSTSQQSIYQLWGAVRNIANVAFVIAFLIIIFSEISNNFISNYTVKKLLPRVIVAAILVNTSFWICAVAIDISNILGQSIQDLFSSLRNSLGPANTVDLPTWADVTTGILGGGGVAIGATILLGATGGTVGGLVFLLLAALIPAIFAVLVAVAILAARQALITIFVIIAPLAFVAFLLPNTEEWFNKWRKLFMTLLIMFPAFSLIFGGSQLAGAIIIQNASDISVALLGLTVQIVPLFITPFLIRLSSGLLGTIAGIANDRSKGVFDRAKNWTNNNREMHRQRGFGKSPERRGDRFRPTGLARRVNNGTLKREAKTAAYKEAAGENFHGTSAYAKIDEIKRLTDQSKRINDASHDEHWRKKLDSSSPHYDQAVYNQELRAVRAVNRAEVAKTAFESESKEIEAGKIPIHITPGSLTGALAADIHDTATIVAAQGMRKQQAERALQIEIADVLKANGGSNIHIDIAKGVMGDVGKNSVLATAKSTAGKAFMDDVKNIQDTIDHPVATNVDELDTLFRSSTTMTQRIAYAGAVVKNGGPGVKKLDELATWYENSGASASDLQEFKEMLGTNGDIRKASKHFDDWINNTRDPVTKQAISLDTLKNDQSTWSNMAPEKFASMNAAMQEHALDLLARQNPTARGKLVGALQRSPDILRLVKTEVQDQF